MNPFPWIVLGIILLLGLVGIGMYGCPQYNVYQQRLTGESELARAQQNRQIAVNEAQAKMDAAKLLAQAEIERAKGVAQANQIIANGLKGNEEYLRYLWITDVAAGGKESKTIVYIPTEANMPILEAGHRPPR
jgi:regulator of protease activity HflC (stomatin/prohibitin superfamily)